MIGASAYLNIAVATCATHGTFHGKRTSEARKPIVGGFWGRGRFRKKGLGRNSRAGPLQTCNVLLQTFLEDSGFML